MSQHSKEVSEATIRGPFRRKMCVHLLKDPSSPFTTTECAHSGTYTLRLPRHEGISRPIRNPTSFLLVSATTPGDSRTRSLSNGEMELVFSKREGRKGVHPLSVRYLSVNSLAAFSTCFSLNDSISHGIIYTLLAAWKCIMISHNHL